MEVLFISHKYPPGIGGMQKQSFELINGFIKSHKVHMIVHDESRESKFYFFLLLRYRIHKTFKLFPGIQIVHCNDGVCAFFCRYIHKRYNRPVLLTFHGLDLLWPNSFYQAMLPGLVKNFSAVVSVSEFTRKQCVSRGFRSEICHTVLNGVDVNDGADPLKINSQLIALFKDLKLQDKKILVSIGRPVRRKGFSWFAKNVLTKLDASYAYVVLGPSTHYSRLEKYLLNLLPHKFRNQLELFFGWSSDQDELSKYLASEMNQSKAWWFDSLTYDSILFALDQADLFVMPNVHVEGDAEGFGLVALESNMQNTFVLASQIDGIPSAVNDKYNGWLLQSGNSSDWVKGIRSFFKLSINERTRLALKAKEYALNKYSWDNMVSGYEDVFNKYINKNTDI